MGHTDRFLATPDAPALVREQVRWLMERSAQAAILTDSLGLIEYVNPAFEVMTGYQCGEAVGQTPAILKSGRHGREFVDRLWTTLRAGGEFHDVMVNRKKTGDIYYQEQTIRPLFDAKGRITHFLSSGRDVSEHIASIARLTRMATHDALTDLPNRTLFLDRLDQAMCHARRHGEDFAVAMLDVDRFKAINDSQGHAAGDAVLRSVANRLLNCVRKVDTVARLGGDEFGLLLPGAVDAPSAVQALRKVVAAFAPVKGEDPRLRVTVSVGASLCPATGDDGRELLELADDAMYLVKRRGGNAFHLCQCEEWHVAGSCH